MLNRIGSGNRPGGSFSVNGSSWQSGFRTWCASTDTAFVNMTLRGMGAPLQPITLSGAPALPLFTGSALGIVPQSQTTGGHERAWDSGLPGALNGLTSLTLAYWIYPNDIGGGSYWGQGDAGSSCFCETNGSAVGPFWRGGSDLRGAFTEVATTGSWQHIAWTANAGSTNYYRNGVLKQTVGSGCGTISASSPTGLFIGGQRAGSGGDIPQAVGALWADFRVYPYLCTPNQVWELYSPRSRWDLYWQPNTRAYSFMSAIAAGTAGYLLVKN